MAECFCCSPFCGMWFFPLSPDDTGKVRMGVVKIRDLMPQKAGVSIGESLSEMKEKFSYQPIYEQTVCEMTDEQKCVIEKYVGLTEQCAEEENQQAYLQGMVDMLLLLSGSGILKVPSNMLEKIKQWK